MADSKPTARLPQSAILEFPLPNQPGVEVGSVRVQRPSLAGRILETSAAPGGPYWEQLLLMKDGKSILEFGFLLGTFQPTLSTGGIPQIKDALVSIDEVPEKSNATQLTFRITFKDTSSSLSSSGWRVAYSNYDGWLPIATDVRALDVTIRRGPVSIAYDPYELSLISSRVCVSELTLAYLSAIRLGESRKFLIDPNRLFQIMTTYRVVPEVNERTSFGATSQKRFTALANLLNREMASWNECLYDALEPETDTRGGFQLRGAVPEEPSIPKPGQPPKPPGYKRITPQRIFRKVRLPVHELAMVKRLEAMKASGASAEKIRTYRALVNRVLLDRLMVDHWDRTLYLHTSSMVLRGMTMIGAPDLMNQPFALGSDIPPLVPAPTELLRLTLSEPQAAARVGKPSPSNRPAETKGPLTIPDDFNPLTHEVLYDKDGNPVEVRRKKP